MVTKRSVFLLRSKFQIIKSITVLIDVDAHISKRGFLKAVKTIRGIAPICSRPLGSSIKDLCIGLELMKSIDDKSVKRSKEKQT